MGQRKKATDANAAPKETGDGNASNVVTKSLRSRTVVSGSVTNTVSLENQQRTSNEARMEEVSVARAEDFGINSTLEFAPPVRGPKISALDESWLNRGTPPLDGDLSPTKFRFPENAEDLKTLYAGKHADVERNAVYCMGVLSIRYRIEDLGHRNSKKSSSRHSSYTASPKKYASKDDPATLAYVVRWQWKTGQVRKVCEFLVPVNKKLDRDAYEKPQNPSGDSGEVISFLCKDLNVWKEFITMKFDCLEQEISSDPSRLKLHWGRIGLQSEDVAQHEEVFIWNSKLAHVYDETTKSFRTTSLEDAGFYPVSLARLDEVTVSHDSADTTFFPELLKAIGPQHFVSFLGVTGQADMSLKPKRIAEIVRHAVPTTAIVGPSGTGKSTLAQSAAGTKGSDGNVMSPFSFNALSAHEYSKRCETSTVPTIISDPPKKHCKEYMDLTVFIYDGTKRRSHVGTFAPSGAPICCVNEDFLECCASEQKAWDRFRTRLIVLGLEESVPFHDLPNIAKHPLHKRVHAASSNLPQLLYYDGTALQESFRYFEDVAQKLLTGTALDDTGMSRIARNLALFYALGEHACQILLPTFEFRKEAQVHLRNTALPSALKYQTVGGIKNASQKLLVPLAFPNAISVFLEETILCVIAKPAQEWYDWIQFHMKHKEHDTIAIRTTAFATVPGFPFANRGNDMKEFLNANTDFGTSDRVSFRTPTGQKSQRALLFYYDELDHGLQKKLYALDIVARKFEYGQGWTSAADIALNVVGADTVDSLTDVMVAVEDGLAKMDNPPSQPRRTAASLSRTTAALMSTSRSTQQYCSKDTFTDEKDRLGFIVWFDAIGKERFRQELSFASDDGLLKNIATSFWQTQNATEKRNLVREAMTVEDDEEAERTAKKAKQA